MVPEKLPLHTAARLPLAAASLAACGDELGEGWGSEATTPQRGRSKEKDGGSRQADDSASSVPLASIGVSRSRASGGHDDGVRRSLSTPGRRSRSSRLSTSYCEPWEFPRRPLLCRLSPSAWERIEELFSNMSNGDQDGLTPQRAMNFFTGTFRKMSVDAMFNEVDLDHSGNITGKEFAGFWLQVRRAYSEEDILQEVEFLLAGNPWVDWDDQRDTKDAGSKKDALAKVRLFHKRPIGCKLSEETWAKIEDLYFRLLLQSTKDAADKPGIVWEDAKKLFTASGSFGKHSANVMFDEVDVDRSGCITPKEFCDFWVRVRKAGYSEETISDELTVLLEGGSWVDWRANPSSALVGKASRSSMTRSSEQARGSPSTVFFPKRPRWCCLSKDAWTKLEELYAKLAKEERRGVTREDAQHFFKGAFAGVSAQAMFNQVDVDDSGNITGQEFAEFWIQIRKSGYPESRILDEVQKLLSGDSWVDFGQQ